MKLTNSLGFALHNAIIALVVLGGGGAFVAEVAERINDEIVPAAHATGDKRDCKAINDTIKIINAYGTDDAGWEVAVATGNPVVIVSKLRSGVNVHGFDVHVSGNPEDYVAYHWDAKESMLTPPTR